MNLSDFRFPAPVSRLGRLLPTPVASAPLLLMLEVARRRQWLTAPETLYGKTFLMHIEDLGLDLSFVCHQGVFKPQYQAKAQMPDVRLAASAMDFFKLASGMEDADTLFFRRRLKMEGDTELGVAVKYWIDATERPAWLRNMAEKLGAT